MTGTTRTLAITQNISLDGSIEFLGDWFDPTDTDPQQLEALMRLSAQGDALLLGRQTFEDFRSYWPKQTDDPTGIAASLDAVQKYVVSSTLTDPDWARSTVLTGDWLTQVAELKQRPGRDIGVAGSIRLCHALIAAGLVDEYQLFVYPTVQGRGRRLFPDGYELRHLAVIERLPFDNGVTLLRYSTY